MKTQSFLNLAGVAFCYLPRYFRGGKGKRAITSPIIFSLFGEEYLSADRQATFCFPSKPRRRKLRFSLRGKESGKNEMIIFNSGLLAGYRNTNGSFNNRGTNANIWSSLESGSNAWRRNLNSGNATVNRNANNKLYGFSVRCIKRWFTPLNNCGANLTGFNLMKYEYGF